MLAIQHVRDNRDFGGCYSDQDLVWEVASADEGEDYYEIRLSYRPAGRFAGESGIEQLTIDKTGSVELRQILDEPRAKRSVSMPVLAIGTAREWRGPLPGDVVPGSRLDLRLVMTKFAPPGVQIGYELLLMGP